MFKKINITGIIVLIGIILVIQLGTAFVISPFLSSFIVDKLNDNAGAKIQIDYVRIWPLTLSCSLKELKVFDPET